jgi:hypothetical protein
MDNFQTTSGSCIKASHVNLLHINYQNFFLLSDHG